MDLGVATHSFTSKSSSATPLCSCWSRPTERPPPFSPLCSDRPEEALAATDRATPRSKSKRRRPLAGDTATELLPLLQTATRRARNRGGRIGNAAGLQWRSWGQAIQIGSVGRAECLLLGAMFNFTWVSAACSIARRAATPLSSAAMATFGTRWLALFEK